MFTGKISTNTTKQKLWKTLRFSLEKYSNDFFKEYTRHVSFELTKWKRMTKQRLNIQLPKKYWHKKRPNRFKKFPYRNTGKQVDSVDAGLKINVTGSGNKVITAWAEIGVPYAWYTNRGLRERNDGKRVMWRGWLDDIFEEGGRGGIKSVVDIFEEMLELRALYK